MSYPVGLPTKNVSFGRAVVLESGSVLGMRVNVKASRNLVYRPTGQPLVSIATIFSSAGDVDGILALPVCDSHDMGLGNGTSIVIADGEVTHTYIATIDYLDPSSGSVLAGIGRTVGPFVVLSSFPSTIDLDDLIGVPGANIEGSPVSVPDIWSTQIAQIRDEVQQLNSTLDARIQTLISEYVESGGGGTAGVATVNGDGTITFFSSGSTQGSAADNGNGTVTFDPSSDSTVNVINNGDGTVTIGV